MSDIIDPRPSFEQLILLEGDEPDETIHEFWERKERRIVATRKPQTVNLIKAVEQAYEDELPDDACEKICRMMRNQVTSKKNHWSKQARNGGIRLYPDDFEAVFWEAVQTTILEDYSGGDFWLYENILKKIDSRALDKIRWAKRKCRKHDYMADSLDAITDMPDPRTSNIEDDVCNRDLIQQMMLEQSLNDNERRLLRYLYDEPDASLRQIASDLELGHKETARRMLHRLRQKLTKYNEISNVVGRSEAGSVAS
jgi:hypothetical protein